MPDIDQIQCIEDMNVPELMAMARQFGMPKTVRLKKQLVDAFARMIAGDMPRLLEQCSPTERNCLAEAAYNGGKVSNSAFRAKYGEACPDRYSWKGEAVGTAFRMLTVPNRDGRIKLPPGTADALRELLPKPSKLRVKTVGPLPRMIEVARRNRTEERTLNVYEGGGMVLQQARRILGLAQAGKLKIAQKSKRPTDATVRLIGESLLEPDFDLEPPEKERDKWTDIAGPVRAYAWGVLVQQCGWCRAGSTKLSLTRTGKKCLSGMTADDLKEGVELLWLDDKFDEMRRIENIRGQTGRNKRYITPPSSRRDSVLTLASEWPQGEWISFDDAFRSVMAADSEFRVTEDPWGLYLCERGYGSLGYDTTGDDIERQYMRALLLETLATLGVIDVAYVYPHYLWPDLAECWGTDDLCFIGRYDGLVYVRLNDLGAYCLGVAADYVPPETETRDLFKVLPNRDLAVVGTDNPSPAERSMLDLYATRESDSVWRLSKANILSYIEDGGQVLDVRQFIESSGGGVIPQTVSRFLDDIARNVEAVVGVSEAELVEFRDAVTAALVAHDSRTGKLCSLAGDRHVAVPNKSRKAFRTALKKLGYVLPA